MVLILRTCLFVMTQLLCGPSVTGCDASASAAKKALAHARAQHAETAKQHQPRCGLIVSVPTPLIALPMRAAPLIALPMHAFGEQAPMAGGQPVRSMPSSDGPQAAAYRRRRRRGWS